MPNNVKHSLIRAIQRDGPPSSDYDLNPDVRLPKDRRLRPAAVLVPILDRADGAHVILTKRSSALKHHPGQISFPGGKVEKSDATCQATALREAQEEIGLSPKTVEILGTLPPHETVTSFSVTPVIAIVPEFDPIPEAGEVAEVFSVPLMHLLNTANYRKEGRRWMGEKRWYFTAPYGPYYIWGATARIMHALADRMDDPNQG